MAQTFSPVLLAGDKSMPIKGPDGKPVIFHCDFQWKLSNYLCQPFGLFGNKLKKGNCINNLKYNINGGGRNYLDFPNFKFSLGLYSYLGIPACFMFPRYRKGSSVVCARLNTELYLAENTKTIVSAYRLADNSGEKLELVECPFSQFDDPYKFDTLPTADDGTFWGVRYDKAFYGGIKLIS